MQAFSSSPHSGALALFFEAARAEVVRRAGEDGVTLDAASGWSAETLAVKLGPLLAQAIVDDREESARVILSMPMPLDAAGTLDYMSTSVQGDKGAFTIDKKTPLALSLAIPGREWIARELFKRPEIVKAFGEGTLKDPATAKTRGYVSSRSNDRVSEFRYLVNNPGMLARVWPVVCVFFTSLPDAERSLMTDDWSSALLLSRAPEARAWARDALSPSQRHEAYSNMRSGDWLERFCAVADAPAREHALENFGAKALLGLRQAPFALWLMALHMRPADFGAFAAELRAADPDAFKVALSDAGWVLEERGSSKLRKKGDFLAWCVARHLIEPARAVKRLCQGMELPTRYARDVSLYCAARDPENFGPKTRAAWESLLLDDELALIAAASRAAEPQPEPSERPEAAESESAPAAPRRRARL
jgi:hypothetical protein